MSQELLTTIYLQFNVWLSFYKRLELAALSKLLWMFQAYFVMLFEERLGKGSTERSTIELCGGFTPLAGLKRNIWSCAVRWFLTFMCGHSGCRQDTDWLYDRQALGLEWFREDRGMTEWVESCSDSDAAWLVWGQEEGKDGGGVGGVRKRGGKRTDRGRDTSTVCLMYGFPGGLLQ